MHSFCTVYARTLALVHVAGRHHGGCGLTLPVKPRLKEGEQLVQPPIRVSRRLGRQATSIGDYYRPLLAQALNPKP